MLKADVWRDALLREEAQLNATLARLEDEGDDTRFDDARDEAAAKLAEVHSRLADMEAETGPARAAALLAGLGFSEADQSRPTRSFAGKSLGGQGTSSRPNHWRSCLICGWER